VRAGAERLLKCVVVERRRVQRACDLAEEILQCGRLGDLRSDPQTR
jgi:hypothetical protein